ncbi:MFS transporter [Micromonospora echinospora]
MPVGNVRHSLRNWATELVPARGPARSLALPTLVQSIGYGTYLSAGAIFFVQVIGLSAPSVGLGLAIANVCGLICTVPLGRLADRVGPRRLLVIDGVAVGLLFMAYWAVGSFPGFLVVATLIAIGEFAANPLRMALIHRLFGPAERVRVAAQMRSLFNLGFVVGAGAAGVALTVGGRVGFATALLVTGVAQIVAAGLIWRSIPAVGPSVPPPAEGTAARRSTSGLRDVRFIGLSLVSGVLELYQPIVTVILPLWIVSRTDAPASLNSLLLGLNALLVITFQVLLSRGADSPGGAARLMRSSSLLLAGGCVLFALSQGRSVVTASVILVIGAVVLALGELRHAAGSWGLSLHLPPAERQGEYQGVFAMGRGALQAAGTATIPALVVGWGGAGWLLVAGGMLVAGALSVPLTRSSERALRRPPAVAQPVS